MKCFLFCRFSALEGTAKLNKDFTFTSTDSVFEPGEVYLGINVPILSDDFTEDEENFTISMASADGGVTTVTQGAVTITIPSNSEFARFAFFFYRIRFYEQKSIFLVIFSKSKNLTAFFDFLSFLIARTVNAKKLKIKLKLARKLLSGGAVAAFELWLGTLCCVPLSSHA